MMREAILSVIERTDLDSQSARSVMHEMMDGKCTSGQIAAFVTAMRMKGETQEELLGFASAMRERAVPVACPPNAIDLCGTGGDGSNTFNISTVSSFVVAAAGVPVAKHGNRAISSRAGSADLLMALGIPPDLGPESVSTCIEGAGIGFMFAPRFHEAMKNVASTRREIGFRTFFNVIGPLSNPAGVKHQMIGIFDPGMATKVAGVLRSLGTERALIVHGNGLDEITDTGPSKIVELRSGEISRYDISPESFDLELRTTSDLAGGTPEENARIALAILRNRDPKRMPIVAMNAGAALYVAGHSDSIEAGIAHSFDLIESGAALRKLEEFSLLANSLERDRQISEQPSQLRDRRIHPDILRSRCSELTNDSLSLISGSEKGASMIDAIDPAILSSPNVLSVIITRRIQRLMARPSVELSRLKVSEQSLSQSIASRRGISLIIEYKPRSPSTPPLRIAPDPELAAAAFEGSDASGVSVLVEQDFFGGGEPLFAGFRSKVSKPMLFKDFVVSEHQVEIAGSLGADAVLLIAKALKSESLDSLVRTCISHGLEPLVEVHDEADLRKLQSCNRSDEIDMIGINSRDLRTLQVNLDTICDLRRSVPSGRLLIAESGVQNGGDLQRLKGFDAALIGSSLMASQELSVTLDELVSAGRSVVP